jgi:hypothetical protein
MAKTRTARTNPVMRPGPALAAFAATSDAGCAAGVVSATTTSGVRWHEASNKTIGTRIFFAMSKLVRLLRKVRR